MLIRFYVQITIEDLAFNSSITMLITSCKYIHFCCMVINKIYWFNLLIYKIVLGLLFLWNLQFLSFKIDWIWIFLTSVFCKQLKVSLLGAHEIKFANPQKKLLFNSTMWGYTSLKKVPQGFNNPFLIQKKQFLKLI